MNKNPDIYYKLKRLIDSKYPEGEGDFYILRQSNQLNVNNDIA